MINRHHYWVAISVTETKQSSIYVCICVCEGWFINLASNIGVLK